MTHLLWSSRYRNASRGVHSLPKLSSLSVILGEFRRNPTPGAKL
jgi:hypothetical protein